MKNNAKKTKVAIIGCGNVGSTIAYALATHYVVDELVLIDKNRNKAMGDAIDMRQALRRSSNTVIYDGGYADIAGCDIIIISVGVARKPGQTRMDLLQKNMEIGKDVADNIKKHYTGGVVLVVFNPVDVMTYLMAQWLELPKGIVIGSGTMLDSARFDSEISRYFDVDIRCVNTCILGEHGDKNVPVWSLSNIAGMHIEEYGVASNQPFTQAGKQRVVNNVKEAGSMIIENKGFTCYGIAAAILNIVEAIIRDTNVILPLSIPLCGEYGMEKTAVSLLCVVGKNGVKQVLTPHLLEEEKAALCHSGERIRTTLCSIAL